MLCYSDGGTCEVSATEKLTAATSIFLTEDTYRGMLTNIYTVESTTEGELKAIWQALKYAVTSYPDENDLEIISDCQSLVGVFKKLLKGSPLYSDAKYYDIWVDIMRMCEGKNVSCSHIKGHQVEHNPNKVCDLVSSFILAKMR